MSLRSDAIAAIVCGEYGIRSGDIAEAAATTGLSVETLMGDGAAALDRLLSFLRENTDTLAAYAGMLPKQVLADLILALGEEETR